MMNEEELAILMLSLREINNLARFYKVKLGDRPLFQIIRELAVKRLLVEVTTHKERS